MVTTREINPEENGTNILMTVPRDLILGVECVEGYAKSDKHLREVLEVMGEWGRVSIY